LNLIKQNFNGNSIRVILIENEPWFVANDIAKALDLSNSRKAISDMHKRLEKISIKSEVVTRSYTLETNGGNQKVSIVSEIGLYELAFVSKKDEAILFRHWIASDVLPQIRKTGSYSLQKEEKSKYAEIISETKEVLELIDLMKDLSPKELFYLQKIMGEKSPTKLLGNSFQNAYFLPSEIGKMTGQSGAEINLILEKKGFQFRDENGVWKPTSSGKEFCLEIGNAYNQIKWKLETILNQVQHKS
jgi:prophage antirepressor-like protein